MLNKLTAVRGRNAFLHGPDEFGAACQHLAHRVLDKLSGAFADLRSGLLQLCFNIVSEGHFHALEGTAALSKCQLRRTGIVAPN